MIGEPLNVDGWLRQKDKRNEHVAGRIRIGHDGFTFEPHDCASGKRIRCSASACSLRARQDYCPERRLTRRVCTHRTLWLMESGGRASNSGGICPCAVYAWAS